MKYLLFLLLTYPCSAQYLEYSVEKLDTGGYSFDILHELYLEEGIQRISIVITAISNSPECQPGPGVTLSIYNATATRFFDHGARLVAGDRTIHLFRSFVDQANDNTILTSYRVSLLLEDLKELNTPGTAYEISGYQLPEIRPALDEYLRRILTLPECQ